MTSGSRVRSVSKSSKDTLEGRTRTRARRGSIERAIIGTLALGGLLTVAMMAPKVASLIRREHIEAVLPPDPRQRLQETLSKLKKKGLVRFENRSGRAYPVLTKSGKERAERIRMARIEIRRPRRWDGRWRMVIFDIPHTRRALRDSVRHTLKRLGFYRLQNSVWVHPYDCEEIISLLKLHSAIRTEVRYVIADAIEYDRPLCEYFAVSH